MYSHLLPKTKKKLKARSTPKSAIAVLPNPLPGKQTQFYESGADIVLFGGSAGGGKSFSLLLDLAKPEFINNSAVLKSNQILLKIVSLNMKVGLLVFI